MHTNATSFLGMLGLVAMLLTQGHGNQEHPQVGLLVPDGHKVAHIETGHIQTADKVRPDEKAALTLTFESKSESESESGKYIARDLIVFATGHPHRAYGLPSNNAAIVSLIVPDRFAGFIEENRTDIRILRSGMNDSCPGCSPGRIGCGACCGEDWIEDEIDWTKPRSKEDDDAYQEE